MTLLPLRQRKGMLQAVPLIGNREPNPFNLVESGCPTYFAVDEKLVQLFWTQKVVISPHEGSTALSNLIALLFRLANSSVM